MRKRERRYNSLVLLMMIIVIAPHLYRAVGVDPLFGMPAMAAFWITSTFGLLAVVLLFRCMCRCPRCKGFVKRNPESWKRRRIMYDCFACRITWEIGVPTGAD